MAVIGLGVDLCSVARIRRILEGPQGARFIARVYTEAEQAFCRPRADAPAAFAARFAAKEALVKALGAPPGLRWRDMEVMRAGGPPTFRLSGVAQAELQRRGAQVLLSVSHDGEMAMATVIVQTEER